MLNQISLVGKLASEIKLRKTTDNSSVINFILEVERPGINDPEKQSVDYIPCVAWNKQAEYIAENVLKNDLIALVGRLKFNEWIGENDKTYRQAEVTTYSVFNYDAVSKEDRLVNTNG